MARSGAAASSRQERIRDLLLEHGTVRSDELAKILDVSVMTIYRDLDTLADQGWLRKTRGGATVQRSALFELNVRARLEENRSLKTAIGAAAATLISHGDAVILDDSTSALAMVEPIKEIGPITLVTNFRKIIDATVDHPGIDLIVLGGQYHPSYDSFFGPSTVDSLADLYADIAFVSASAVNGNQCLHPIPEAIAVKKAMLAAATAKVLLLDHSKFAKRALHRFAAIEDFDVIVVDADISDAHLSQLREQVERVVVADREPRSAVNPDAD
ncbi:MAG: DeoR/GlpR family DNA-binding transcription regulator [Mycobacterium sp.]